MEWSNISKRYANVILLSLNRTRGWRVHLQVLCFFCFFISCTRHIHRSIFVFLLSFIFVCRYVFASCMSFLSALSSRFAKVGIYSKKTESIADQERDSAERKLVVCVAYSYNYSNSVKSSSSLDRALTRAAYTLSFFCLLLKISRLLPPSSSSRRSVWLGTNIDVFDDTRREQQKIIITKQTKYKY